MGQEIGHLELPRLETLAFDSCRWLKQSRHKNLLTRQIPLQTAQSQPSEFSVPRQTAAHFAQTLYPHELRTNSISEAMQEKNSCQLADISFVHTIDWSNDEIAIWLVSD